MLSISQLASYAGVTVRTVRHYHAKGLLPEPVRDRSGYRAYDASGLPAVLSRRIVTGLLRGKLGFDGVVISDALGAPGPSSRPHPNVTAVGAGVDVLLYTSESGADGAFRELLAATRSGALPLTTLRAANTRIAALKQRLR